MEERERCKERQRREEGIEEILPLVFSQTVNCLTVVRVSAAELALFHTGAILSSLGYCPPATATWEHLGEDKKCSFGASVEVFICLLCVCVNASSCFRRYLYNQPPLHPLLRPLSVSTTVQSARDLEANLLKCVSRNFPLCWDIFVFFNLVFSCNLS